MESLKKAVVLVPELQDQLDFLQNTLHKEDHLSQENRKVVAWATAVASQDTASVELIKSEMGELSADEKKIVTLASSRMAITNPYFMSRNVFPLQSGGSLAALGLRPFQELNVENETAYHYACIAISSVNNGFVCFSSHMSSLQSLSQSDEAMDQAMRIITAVRSSKQIMFNLESVLAK